MQLATVNSPFSFQELQDKKFQKILTYVVAIFIVVSIVVPFLPIFEIEREKKEKIPQRFAKVLMQKQQVPPKPPAPAKKPKPEPDKPKEQPKVETKKKAPTKKKEKVKTKKSIQEKVAKVGLLALRSDLNELRDDAVLQRISNPNRKLVKGAKTATKSSRTNLVKNVNRGSGGIDTSKLSRQTTKTELEKRKLTQVSSSIKSGGDEKRKGDARINVRTIEEIRLVLERYKGSFTTLYSRQLRKTPGIKGTVLFELTIAPSGTVLNCKVVQSELKSPRLEKKFVIKLKSLNFGAKDVDTTVINYPLDFFPS